MSLLKTCNSKFSPIQYATIPFPRFAARRRGISDGQSGSSIESANGRALLHCSLVDAELYAPALVGGRFDRGIRPCAEYSTQAQGEDVAEASLTGVEDCLEHRRIGAKAKAALKQLVAKELKKLVKELLDDCLHTSYHNS